VSGKTVPPGRWPANLIHDGSQEVLDLFASFGEKTSGKPGIKRGGNNGAAYGAESRAPGTQMGGFGDTGTAARFFYTAKADGDERIGSKHPTVKPIDLMRYLVRLVTPSGGTVLDPFAGTGTTGEAAYREGFNAVLIEREAQYLEDIARRMELVMAGPDERRREIIKASGKAELAGPLFDFPEAAE
jgi:site-specific DNA-methyltransferase (adenine-specific)